MSVRTQNRCISNKLLHTSLLSGTLGLALVALPAHACSIPDGKTQVQAWPMPAFDAGSSTATEQPSNVSGASVSSASHKAGNDPITGLWKVNFLAHGNATIPDGTVIDAAVVTWHADGTELMNSAKPPVTSNFCQGVWQRTDSTYTLNHVALGWAPDSTFIGPVSIHETVVLSHNATLMTGTFTITQYAQDGTTVVPLRPDLPAVSVVGSVIGGRVFADQ